jgi:hypothetical protein
VIDHAGQAPPADLLFVLNGQVAGVAVLGTAVGTDEVAFTALLAPDLVRPGGNDLGLLVPTVSGSDAFAQVPVRA